jgi:hypothetical protein
MTLGSDLNLSGCCSGKDWVVAYTKGKKPKWFEWERLFPQLRNRSGQNFLAQVNQSKPGRGAIPPCQ